ncbi:sensor histidine kinase [Paenibacillus sp. IB182496]|uniref:Oxygen sensor histidine kinase NreB n=1 Tax=Paenibacillus sabuli TaxID=2772509 RepID=A0A927BUP5_9BACL|nr:sensor histidine kinase [Paenibacillus sabuli]MBD2847168.1 sensor histidine kinase [Paenibacillus sabuli]
MEDKKPVPKVQPNQRRNTAETVLWLLVIVGLLVLVLQGAGYLEWFQLQGAAAAIGLSFIGLAMISVTIYGYLQRIKLKETIKRLTEQQRRRSRSVTLSDEESDAEGAEEDEAAEDRVWQEKVRFTAVIEERQRLARELHDAVSQQLFAISMTATAVGRTIDKDFERARRQVELIEEMASVAQSEMRALLLHLRPIQLDGKTLAQALRTLLDELKQKVPMEIRLEMDESIRLLPQAEDHLFRIVQESLSNTLRHARADQMEIAMFRYGNQIRLTLRDNGVGFDPESKKQTSYGLLTMQERVTELGGAMQLLSAPKQGTTIEIAIPALADQRGNS